MSRRFGRNQRRRARERIAELDLEATNLRQSHAMDRALLASAGERNRALAEIIDLVREELPNHPLLPLEGRPLDLAYMEDDLRHGQGFRFALKKPMPRALVVEPDARDMDAEWLEADVVALMAQTDFCELRQQVHMRIQLGQEAAAYGISTQALMTMDPVRLESILTREIARALACLLVAQWQSPGRHRGRA